jgi:argininosuccinate lyase
MHEFNQSFSYDQRMYKADILGSQAYAAGLVKAGILTQEEQKVHLAAFHNHPLTSSRPFMTDYKPS